MPTYIIDLRRPSPKGPYAKHPVELPVKWHTIEAENDEEALAYVAGLTRFRRRIVRVGDFVILHVVGEIDPPAYVRTRDGFMLFE
jgi:hypothetical protein